MGSRCVLGAGQSETFEGIALELPHPIRRGPGLVVAPEAIIDQRESVEDSPVLGIDRSRAFEEFKCRVELAPVEVNFGPQSKCAGVLRVAPKEGLQTLDRLARPPQG